MQFKKLYRTWRRPRYEPLNKIEIQKQHILHNIRYLQHLQPDAEILPVLKSNAYGHGLEQMCTILEESPVKMVIVDSFPEAQIVYHSCSKRVLLLGEASAASYKYCHPKRTDFVVYNIETLQLLAETFHQPRVHLFINTGMNREGIGDVLRFLEEAKHLLPKVRIVGICSHLASADIISDLNDSQVNRFFDALEIVQQYGISPQYVHLGNSAGVFLLKDKRLTAFRPGIAVYGYNVFAPEHPLYVVASQLKPALKVLSTVVSLQHVPKGASVSYIERYKAPCDTTIAIVPFGYFEGLDRRLSNQGKVKIAGQYCTIAGQVCMNLTCVDVGNLPVSIGDTVEIYTSQEKEPHSIASVALLEHTIPYEVLVKLYQGIRREVV